MVTKERARLGEIVLMVGSSEIAFPSKARRDVQIRKIFWEFSTNCRHEHVVNTALSRFAIYMATIYSESLWYGKELMGTVRCALAERLASRGM